MTTSNDPEQIRREIERTQANLSTDVDALTVSMSRAGAELTPSVAAYAIAIGILANTILKLSVSLALGTSRFRRVAGIGLAGLAVGSAIGLAL